MRMRSRVLAVGIGMAFAAGGLPPALAAPNPSPTPHLTPAPQQYAAEGKQGRSHTLTLITGDVVNATVQPDGRIAATVQPRSGLGHYAKVIDGQTYYIPKQAAAHVAAGVLDRELFNLKRLIRHGYDDASQTTLPLIVSYKGTQSARQAPPLDGGSMVARLDSINAVAVQQKKRQAGDFWKDLTGLAPGDRPRARTKQAALSDGIAKVWLDRKVKANLDVSVPQIGAPEVWKSGHTGKGVTVAVLDTGIAAHPDLDGKVTDARDFSDSETGTDDRTGHGTHVASTIAGSGAASGGKYKGVAPDASIVNGKVLGDAGTGTSSAVIAGMEWAASRADIINMSLGTDEPSDGQDPTSQAVNNLTKSTGALFVVAAGNTGGIRTIGAPAAADAALTVGAVNKQDVLAGFSSAGPRPGDDAIKPDITAPGVGIAAARVKGTIVGDNDPVDDHYARADGTSMASPHVAGAAALLAQQHSGWQADRLKSALTTTAKPSAEGTVYRQGTGRVDVARASTQAITASTTSLNLGRLDSDAGEPVTRPVTYDNPTDEPVTLDLDIKAANQAGTPAGADLLKVAPATLTVPAGGSADATVTLAPTAGENGLYGGLLTATEHGGPSVLRTAVGFNKVKLSDISFKALDRNGKPASAWVSLTSQATGNDYTVDFTAGEPSSVEVEDEGPFTVTGYVSTPDAAGRHEVEQTLVTFPDLAVTDDTEVVLDATKARPVTLRLERPTDALQLTQNVYRKKGKVNLRISGGTSETTERISAVPSNKADGGEFEYTTMAHRVAPPLSRVRVTGSDISLDARYMGLDGFSNAKLDGRQRLGVIDVGAGRPEDYEGKDVSGKIALIAFDPDVSSSELIATAAEHKAKAALIYGNEPGLFHDGSVWLAKIPPLEISRVEGLKLLELLKEGPVALDIRADASVPYDYKLLLPEKDRVPESLSYRYSDDELASLTSKFHAQYPGQVGAHSLSAFRPHDIAAFSLFAERKFGKTSRHFHIADPGNQYGQFGWNQWPYARYGSVVFPEVYGTPGHHEHKDWFKGPLVPGTTKVHVPSSRNGNSVLLNLATVADSNPDHAFYFPSDDAETRVYENGKLLATGQYPNGTFDTTSGEKATYRVEVDVTDQVDNWEISTSSRTAWTFTSEGTTEDVPLPIINNVWDLPLDGDNSARAGRPFVLKFTPATQFGAPQVPIESAELALSYDGGKTWDPTLEPVQDSSGTFRTIVLHPRKADTDGFVALRAKVTDEKGGTFEQTVVRAYKLH